jgi:tetrapyrrole methylase family protein / MazG family protein
MAITIVGLGPGDPGHLTRHAWEVLTRAGEVYLRTRRHPTVAGLPPDLVLHSFDELYEEMDDFSSVYETITERILELARRTEGVVYAVPGHPLVGESSVVRILAAAQPKGLCVQIVDGLSFVEPVLGLLGIDGLDGLQLADATDVAAAHHPALDPDRPVLIGQLYGRRLASEVKLTLMNAYPEDYLVTLVRAAGMPEAERSALPLYELDQGALLDHLTTLYVPPLPGAGSMAAVQDTMARLRAPDGCPWDREQTHQTLRENLLEETYEVLAALDAEEDEKLCEELGDLLMQIAMHVQIATEEGAFRFADVARGIDAKLRRRHPHVFGDAKVQGTGEVLRNWEAIKAGERRSAAGGEVSRLAGVPTILPALARAQALSARAARHGFDWPDVEGVLGQVGEELQELVAAESQQERQWELGDLLFTLVNVARWLGIDAESALRAACDRFVRRYAVMEGEARVRGVDLLEMAPAEREALWKAAAVAGKPKP